MHKVHFTYQVNDHLVGVRLHPGSGELDTDSAASAWAVGIRETAEKILKVSPERYSVPYHLCDETVVINIGPGVDSGGSLDIPIDGEDVYMDALPDMSLSDIRSMMSANIGFEIGPLRVLSRHVGGLQMPHLRLAIDTLRALTQARGQ